MVRKRVLIASLVLGLTAWILPSPRAEACSLPICVPGEFVPQEGASVPAEDAIFYWRPARSHVAEDPNADPESVSLHRTGDPENALALDATELEGGNFLFEPMEPLQAEESYTLSDASSCESGGDAEALDVQFTARASASPPEALGELDIQPQGVGDLRVASGGGACSAQVEADRVMVELKASPDADSWIDLLHFETYVDGERWLGRSSAADTHPPGESWRGRGVDELYTTCETGDDLASTGLAEGSHEVVFRATLPGTEISLESAPASVELDCGGGGLPGCGMATPGQGASTLAVFGLLSLVAGRVRRARRRPE